MKTLLALTALALTLTAGASTARAQYPLPPCRAVVVPPVPAVVIDLPALLPFHRRHHVPVVVVPEPYYPAPGYYYGRPGYTRRYHDR